MVTLTGRINSSRWHSSIDCFGMNVLLLIVTNQYFMRVFQVWSTYVVKRQQNPQWFRGKKKIFQYQYPYAFHTKLPLGWGVFKASLMGALLYLYSAEPPEETGCEIHKNLVIRNIFFSSHSTIVFSSSLCSTWCGSLFFSC